jgi:hypothetical protein
MKNGGQAEINVYFETVDHVETQDTRMVSSGARAFTAAHKACHSKSLNFLLMLKIALRNH